MIGCDVVAISRVRTVLARHGQRFVVRILTPAEQTQKDWLAPAQAAALARRWAAKEAVAKALGCGIGAALSFQDIEVRYQASGQPVVRIKGQPELALHLSMSDDAVADVAMAVATRV